MLAIKPASNMSSLCRRFKITRRTGYKWLQRFKDKGLSGLKDKSKRPMTFPNQTPEEIDNYVVNLRNSDPEWGSKKLHKIAVPGSCPLSKEI
jgi:transposase-like protein